jgi:chromosome segregation ATPase
MKLRLVLFLTALGIASAAQAYDALPMYLPADTDSMLVLIEIRDLTEIEHDLEEAAAQRADAEVSASRAQMLQARSVTRIKIAESEIGSLKAEIDHAKMQKDEAKKKELEDKKKFAELEKQLLQKRDDLRKNEIDLAKAEVEFHAAQMKGFETELELAHLRIRRAGLEGSVASKDLYEEAHKLAKNMRDIEGKTLKAKIEAAEKGKSLADRSVQIMKARQKVYEARRKVLEVAEGK